MRPLILLIQALVPTGNGQYYSSTYYDKLLFEMPENLPSADFEFHFNRYQDRIQLEINETEISRVCLKFVIRIDSRIPIVWTIHGKPEHFLQFNWSEWSEMLASVRTTFLANYKNSYVEVFAKSYDIASSYEPHLNAMTERDQYWEAEHGLLGTKRIYTE